MTPQGGRGSMMRRPGFTSVATLVFSTLAARPLMAEPCTNTLECPKSYTCELAYTWSTCSITMTSGAGGTSAIAAGGAAAGSTASGGSGGSDCTQMDFRELCRYMRHQRRLRCRLGVQ